MKYIDEYRDSDAVQKLLEAIKPLATQPRSLMEICGGQTHSIIKYGIDQLLPDTITLIHGPGCPVCVTPQSIIDAAIDIASIPDVIFCSFGDMLRVPGTRDNLYTVKAHGGDIRIVYSPLDAVSIARNNPEKQVVFFGVGFETTAPTTAMAVYQAKKEQLQNFTVLVSNVLVPPAMEALLSSSDNRVEGFLAAGHVCTIMGMKDYEPIAKKYNVPVVVTGFEPVDILHGVYLVLKQLHKGKAAVENQYTRSVKTNGNLHAQTIMKQVYQVVNREWRGLGEIPLSGLRLWDEYQEYDAEKRFDLQVQNQHSMENKCISGLILQGIKKPYECLAFGSDCYPEKPLGAPMVSSEGACAAYYRYRRHELVQP